VTEKSTEIRDARQRGERSWGALVDATDWVIDLAGVRDRGRKDLGMGRREGSSWEEDERGSGERRTASWRLEFRQLFRSGVYVPGLRGRLEEWLKKTRKIISLARACAVAYPVFKSASRTQRPRVLHLGPAARYE
jgi:hypothetical protein